MKKDVMVTVSGTHTGIDEPESFEEFPIEVTTRGTYYCKDEKHYIFTEETIPETREILKTRIQIEDGKKVHIFKSGAYNTHLYFEEGRLFHCRYQTEYGILEMVLYTDEVKLEVKDDHIALLVSYSICMDGQPQQDSVIRLNVRSVGTKIEK